ncbi:glutamine-dependent NAD(+) synthetase with GAT domain-containing protein [Canariomyces notabilis]|uniref:Glutamine-dependent NAD(+) synthetase n=1 Tax=Canariomyces notabilis TaxID=2074819 RepID=A0AAN6TFW3_9PEZI|nr:glutamine-dependent NAD(+) synthetase with GAT domain-containing protein [Canariomyces arenarius]
MGHLVTVATCALNQWVLDWEGNLGRIIESIHQAKAAGARLRVGPELEICGYSSLDHFHELDVYTHSLEMLRRLLLDKSTHGILLDIGLPILHRNLRYNCRVICLDGKILLIRPKMWLANDGNYREMRHFTPWMRPRETELFHLPKMLAEVQGETHVLFGDAVISTPETAFGAETCEELFTPKAPHIDMALDGVEIITNSSGSHFTLRKLDTRLQLITEATRKSGGVYLYANQQGCDGERLYFDGCAMIIGHSNRVAVAQGSQFSLNDVEVVTATVDLEEVRAYRASISRGLQAATSNAKYQRIQTPFELSSEDDDADIEKRPTLPIQPRFHPVEEEIALCGGCYLWDYLRRSGAAGYLVPLSGGIDSCATAVIVYSMCRIVMQAVEAGNAQVIDDVKRIAKYGEEGALPKTPQELCNQVFTTLYMGMKKQSSRETRQRARDLSDAIGSYHVNLDIDDVYEAQKKLVVATTGFDPKFKVEGGTVQENLTLQCLQARIRMVTAYEFGQILPTARNRPGGGSLLVLGSANVGEVKCLRGYLTKYDCSSADINPIGSIDKDDLKRFIRWAEKNFDLPCLHGFLTAVPTAELEPITQDYVQSDEAVSLDANLLHKGMTYQELTIFGRLRKLNKLGPFAMFQRLVHDWSIDRERTADDDAPYYTPAQVAEKVKRFFHYYAINRHKMTTLTPALHCNDYSPDDNRFDLRPFLYPPFWKSWSFKRIDMELERIEKKRAGKQTVDR